MILQRDNDRPLLVSETEHYVFIGLSAIFAVFAVTSIVAFHFACQHDTSLQQRGYFFTVVGGLCSAFAGTIYLAFHAELGRWHCFWPLSASYLGTMLYGITVVFRAFRLMILYRFNLQKSKVTAVEQPTPRSRWSRFFGGNAITNRSKLWRNFNGSAKSLANFDRYLRLTWCAAAALTAVYVVIMAIFGETYGFADTAEVAYICKDTWEIMPYYILTLSMVVFVGPYLIYLIHSIKDSYGLQRDVLTCMILGIPILAIFFIWRYVIGLKQSIIIETDWPALFHVIVVTSNVTEPLFRAYLRKRRLTSLSRQQVEAMFRDPIMYSKLDGLAMSSFCAENIRFLDEYQNLKRLTILYYRRQDVALVRQSSNASAQSTPHSQAHSHPHLHATSKVVMPFMKFQRETILPHEDLSSPLVTILESLPDIAWSRPANRFNHPADGDSVHIEMQMMVDVRQSQEMQIPPPLIPHYRAFYNTFIAPNAQLARRQSADDIELLTSAKKNASVCILPIKDEPDDCSSAMQVNISEAAREEACPAIDRPDHWHLGMFDRAHSEVVQMVTFGVAMDLMQWESKSGSGIRCFIGRFKRWLSPLPYPEAGVQSATSTQTTVSTVYKPSARRPLL